MTRFIITFVLVVLFFSPAFGQEDEKRHKSQAFQIQLEFEADDQFIIKNLGNPSGKPILFGKKEDYATDVNFGWTFDQYQDEDIEEVFSEEEGKRPSRKRTLDLSDDKKKSDDVIELEYRSVTPSNPDGDQEDEIQVGNSWIEFNSPLVGGYLYPELPDDPRLLLDKILAESVYQEVMNKAVLSLRNAQLRLPSEDPLQGEIQIWLHKLNQFDVHSVPLEKLENAIHKLLMEQQVEIFIPLLLRSWPNLSDEAKNIKSTVYKFLGDEITDTQMQSEWKKWMSTVATAENTRSSTAREQQRRSDVLTDEPDTEKKPLSFFTVFLCCLAAAGFCLFLKAVVAPRLRKAKERNLNNL